MSTPQELQRAKNRILELESELRLYKADDAFYRLTIDQRDRAWRQSDQDVLRILKLEEALRKVAAPKRSDGTYNRSREACEEIANEALDDKSHLQLP